MVMMAIEKNAIENSRCFNERKIARAKGMEARVAEKMGTIFDLWGQKFVLM